MSAQSMTSLLITREQLIGRVGSNYLGERLSGITDGTARFIIDCLSAEQTASIARAILNDSDLAGLFDIRLPRNLVADQGLPPEVITSERATYHRNAQIERPALLLANTGDDEEQSLRDLSALGAPDLMSHPELWVRVASNGLPLSEEHRRWWIAALNALQELRFVTLDQYADYILCTRQLISEEGLSVVVALGAALPALRLPRHSTCFNAIPDKVKGQKAPWRRGYNMVHTKYACYLSKQKPDGIVLSDEDLREAYRKAVDAIPDNCRLLVEEFINAPIGWSPKSVQLSGCEWEDIRPLFDGLRRERLNLGEETERFYEERDPALLSDDEREYLARLKTRKTTQAELEEDQAFYEAHREELRDNRKLKSVWEKFVFGSPKECTDLIAGIFCGLETFDWSNGGAATEKRTLIIRSDRRFKKDLRDLNVDAGLYFAFRYNGLKALFGPNVQWDVGDLFDFRSIVDRWRAANQDLNRSEKKTALQLKLTIELEVEDVMGVKESHRTQLIWKYDPRCIHSECEGDWRRLAAHPLVLAFADREPANAKGSAQTVDLHNVKSLVASYGQDRGSLVGLYKKQSDVGLIWKENLVRAKELSLITNQTALVLDSLFATFAKSYESAIGNFLRDGLASADLEDQNSAYAELLEAVCREAPGDMNRQLLLRPLLQLGSVGVKGGRTTAIIAPWHPLRLAAMGRKARRAAEIVKLLLTSESLKFGDTRLYFRDKLEELAHPFYPEVALGWTGEQAELLSLTDVAGDYSLHEAAFTGGVQDETNDSPTEGAARVIEMVQRYLALQPHERANLSVVLYNCDSARLPTAVVEKLSALNQEDEDARCQVILRHRDQRRLRSLYEHIVESAGDDNDSFVASEATRDFMARLRIGIMADQAAPPDPKDGCPEDIVFLQDVIARHAKLEWFKIDARPAELGLHNPAQWSRRRPMGSGDMRSVVYLCCPVQTRDGWAFLTALTSFLKGDWDLDPHSRYLPARQLDFRDPTTARILEETHNLGTWVVNFDELLDRRQLLEQGVRIIRYKQSTTSGRNLLVSSGAPLSLLRVMVLRRLRDLGMDLPDSEMKELADRLINDANELSGDIVLRAAKRGRSASELIGLVLSRFLLRRELGANSAVGWFFLDDYASWLGQKEEQIADLLALCPVEYASGERELTVLVSEAKYIDLSSLSVKQKESQKQLVDTLKRIASAVVDPIPRLDRDLWLGRLSDLLVDGTRVGTSAALDLYSWRRDIREGLCSVVVRGYSHVFVSGPSDTEQDPTATSVLPTAVDGLFEGRQETYSRALVRRLLVHYLKQTDPRPVLDEVWGGIDYTSTPARADSKANPLEAQSLLVPQTEPSAVSPQSPASEGSPGGSPQDGGTATSDSVAQDTSAHCSRVTGWITSGNTQPDNDQDAIAWLAEVEKTTKVALQQFKLQSKLVSSVLTPNAALLKFQGSMNLTVDLVLKRRNEFLTTFGLKLIGVQPEPGLVSLSIARSKRAPVSLRALWRKWGVDTADGATNQSLLIGVKEADGEMLVLSPGEDHAPHTLIAGSTGSGKSVLMQNIILSIAATNKPELARITLIDPKQGVDYFAFERLPHLDGGIIDLQSVALSRIHALVEEMDARYKRLREARAFNIKQFNAKVHPTERMPIQWLIHDEFAEWMMVDDYKSEVVAAVNRLGVKARAAGIHLVFAAQRPDATVMPMQLRSNLGNRLILRVDSIGTSELALGVAGAEDLLGRGHLLANLDGEHSPIYAQVPFADPNEIDELVAAICADSMNPME